jgi:CheY-like chemotaxis protein
MSEPHARTVFLVEDSPLLASLLRDALIAHGVADEARVFPEPHAFLAAYRASLDAGTQPLLLVVDVVLPGFTGLVAGDRVRAMERGRIAKSVPIVFFSARAFDDEVRVAVDACFPARYVAKNKEGPAQVALQGAKLLREIMGPTPA